MPEIETFADIDPDDYFEACSSREKKELINIVVEECADDSDLKKELINCIGEYFPQSSSSILGSGMSSNNTFMHDEFIGSLVKLGEAYYRLSNEDIEKINELAKRF